LGGGLTPVRLPGLHTTYLQRGLTTKHDRVFRDKGYIKEVGVRCSVAVVFNRRFLKSKKVTTSNWANRELTESQILYSANNAWAEIQVFHALALPTISPA
jgi:hypothetical protein